jgi:hypothetical protein
MNVNGKNENNIMHEWFDDFPITDVVNSISTSMPDLLHIKIQHEDVQAMMNGPSFLWLPLVAIILCSLALTLFFALFVWTYVRVHKRSRCESST